MIADRSKDIIISGGENISSVEIQDVLYAHPDVADAAVVARPDEKWGETPCAFIELKPGSKVTEKEMNDFCRKRLAGFKRPRTYIFIDLPKTSTGKIQKFKSPQLLLGAFLSPHKICSPQALSRNSQILSATFGNFGPSQTPK